MVPLMYAKRVSSQIKMFKEKVTFDTVLRSAIFIFALFYIFAKTETQALADLFA